MEFLYLLEKIRLPGLNELMLAVTTLGEETAFLVIGLIVFWCVDKRKGYYVMSVGFLGTMANQVLKLACRIPRPWVLDPDFTILEGSSHWLQLPQRPYPDSCRYIRFYRRIHSEKMAAHSLHHFCCSGWLLQDVCGCPYAR